MNSTSTLYQLIHLLNDCEFHSGEELGSALDLTRSAIWKLIKQFPKWDIEIESLKRKGYRLLHKIDLLQSKTVLNSLVSANQKKLDRLEIFESLRSTNDYCLKIAKENKNQTIACLAERQTAGKGRLGRHWISPFAQNIYLSVLWHFPKDVSELSGLSLAVAVGITRALKRIVLDQNASLKNANVKLENKLCVKWPNDVLFQNQKLAGTLIELSCESHHTCTAVIGIGLNVNMSQKNDRQISQPWIDLSRIMGQRIDRNKVAGLLLDETIQTLITFEQQGLAPFISDWQALDYTKNKAIILKTPVEDVKGIAKGINEEGHFLLEYAPNKIKSFSSGDVSLRVETV